PRSVPVPPTSLPGSDFVNGWEVPASAVELVVAAAGCVSAPTTGTGGPGACETGAGATVAAGAGAGEFADLAPGEVGVTPGGRSEPDREAGLPGSDEAPGAGEFAARVRPAVLAVVGEAVVDVVVSSVVAVAAGAVVAVAVVGGEVVAVVRGLVVFVVPV